MTRTLREQWLWEADHEFHGYSPIYERIARAVADDAGLIGRLQRELDRAERQVVLLLAAVHYLLLSGLDHPLREVYAGRSAADPGALFLDLVAEHTEEVLSIVRTHRTQTNEPGRVAVLAPALRVVAEMLGEPLALIEVGASGGINLRLREFRLDYGAAGSTGPEDAPVVIRCEIRGGQPPIAPALPALDPVCGLDRNPIDLTDLETERWLLACVWPDTGRLDRTRAAIEVARTHPVAVHRGDAIDDLPAVVAPLPAGRPLVVVTTWVMAYLPAERRHDFATLLADLATDRPIAWISAEGPGVVAELGEVPDVPRGASVLGLVVHRAGHTESRVLGVCHPHGWWLDWRG